MRKLLPALVVLLSASLARAAVVPISGWLVHNGTSTVGGTSDTPTFTAGDNITLMAPFADSTLTNDGDFIEVQTTLTMNTRTGTGVNTLNTQIRLGLFDDSVNPTLTAADKPNLGFTMEYSNVAAGGLIREQSDGTQTNPFNSPPTTIANGTQDSGADSIQGANPGPVTFDLKLTRDAGKIDIAGTISGTDAVSGHPYLANFNAAGYSSTTFPANGAFTFNRIGLFLGDNVNAASASLASSSVATGTVPEPTSIAMVVGMVGLLATRRSQAR